MRSQNVFNNLKNQNSKMIDFINNLAKINTVSEYYNSGRIIQYFLIKNS